MTPMSDERLLKVKVIMQRKASTISKGFLYGVVADLANEVDRLRADPLRAQVEALRGALEDVKKQIHYISMRCSCTNWMGGGGGYKEEYGCTFGAIRSSRRIIDVALSTSPQLPEVPEEWEYADANGSREIYQRRIGGTGPWQRRNEKGE